MTRKLIIFDLDNTLVITRPAAKAGYKQAIYYLAKTSGIYHDRDKLYNQWKRLVHNLRHESDPGKRQFGYSLGLLLDQQHIPQTHLATALHVFEKELLAHLKVMPGAKDTLSRLKDGGHLITVSTASDNSDARKKLDHLSLSSMIDNLLTASDIGVMKPHPDYYLRLLKKYRQKPFNTLVVGDEAHEDLKPAQALGCQTLLISGGNPHLSLLFERYGAWLEG